MAWQDAVCSGAFQISNTNREIPHMWKSRAGSAVGWFSFRNGTLIGKLQSGNQHRGIALLTKPGKSFQAK